MADCCDSSQETVLIRITNFRYFKFAERTFPSAGLWTQLFVVSALEETIRIHFFRRCGELILWLFFSSSGCRLLCSYCLSTTASQRAKAISGWDMLANWFNKVSVACSVFWEMIAKVHTSQSGVHFRCSVVCTSASAPPQNGLLDCAWRHMGAMYEATSIKPHN